MSRAAFPRFDNRIIVFVLGDYVTDIYQPVCVSKITPDAPAAVWETEGRAIELPGCAGNVARQFAHLSEDVTLVTMSRPSFVPGGANCRLRFLSREAETSGYQSKTRFVSGGHILARLDDNYCAVSHSSLLSREQTGSLLIAAVRDNLRERSVTGGKTADGRKVVAMCSDYAGGFWTPKTAEGFVNLFRNFGVPVVVDPKPRGVPLQSWQGAAVVKLNAAEAIEFAGHGDATDAAITLASRYRFPVVTTFSANPPKYTRPDSSGTFTSTCGEPIVSDRPIWASGAGDCFAAYLTAGLCANSGTEPQDDFAVIRAAHAAGAAYVRKTFNAPVHPREAFEQIEPVAAKVYRNPAELAGRLAALPEGSRVGFTNGCFDLLHPGHMESLRFARSRCDFLAVFLNSDSSYHSLRGKNPVMWWDERAAALANLAAVDAVVMFNELEPSRAFRDALGSRSKADVLVKGEEYRGQEIAGAHYARSIEYAPETSPLHTKEILKRVFDRGQIKGKDGE